MTLKADVLNFRLSVVDDIPAIIQLVKASWARTYDTVIGVEARKVKSDAKHVPTLFLSEIERDDRWAWLRNRMIT